MARERIGEAYVEARLDTSKLADDLARTHSTIARTLQKTGRDMQQAGRAWTTRVTLPIIGAGVAMGKTAATFESELSKIVGLVGVNREQVDAWGRDILEMAPRLGRAPTELAEALFFVTSAGFRGAEAMDVLETSAKAAAAGLGDTATIADAVTSAVNAYGAENLSASRATDILVAAVREGKLEAESLAPVLGRLLPTASAMGVAFEDVAGVLAVMSRTGLDANEAATSLQAIMSTLLKPTDQARDALESVGLTMADLREMAGQPGGLVEVMRVLEGAFADNDEALSTVIPNVRAFRGAMNVLAQEGEIVDGVLAGVTNSAGILEGALAAVSEDVAFRWSQAMAEGQVAAIAFGTAIGESVMPWVEGLMERLGGLAERFDALDSSQQRAMIGVAAGIAAIGPTLWIFGTLVRSIGDTIQGLRFLRRHGADTIGFLRTWVAMVREARQGGASWGSILRQSLNPALLGVGVALAAGVALLALYAHAKREAQRRAEEFAATLDDETGALTDNSVAHVVNDLQRRGAFQLAQQLGIATSDLVDRLLGEEGATRRVNDAIAANIDEHAKLTRDKSQAQLDAEKLAHILGVEAAAVADGTEAKLQSIEATERSKAASGELSTESGRLAAAAEEAGASIEDAAGITDGWASRLLDLGQRAGATADATDGFAASTEDADEAMGEATSTADLLRAALDLVMGSTVDADRAALGFRDRVDALDAALRENGATLDITTEKGRANQGAVLDTVDAVRRHIEALAEDGATMEELRHTFDQHVEDFRSTMLAAGLTEEQVEDLIERYGLLPDQVLTEVMTAGVDSAIGDLRRLNEWLDRIGAGIRGIGRTQFIRVDQGGQQVGMPMQHGGGMAGSATGGHWTGDRPLGSDEFLSVLQDGERVLTPAENDVWEQLARSLMSTPSLEGVGVAMPHADSGRAESGGLPTQHNVFHLYGIEDRVEAAQAVALRLRGA